jgi:hypothetical protein
MLNVHSPISNTFTNEVITNVDVFRAIMKHRILTEGDCRLAVHLQDERCTLFALELCMQLCQPNALTGGRGCTRGKGDGAGAAPRDGKQAEPTNRRATREDECLRCGKFGHWAKDCRSKPKAEAHVAQAEQDTEPSLLMAQAVLNPSSSSPDRIERRPLRVVEGKVFAQLDGDAARDDALWYLDSGATNHMTGNRNAFVNIDTAVSGVVRFGDGSEVAIEGAGSVLFEGKTGEHLPLTGVYFIPRLTHNIISLGQLDEGGCDVHTKAGMLRVRDEHGRLIIKVQRTANRLYLLRIKLAKPLCLAARVTESAWLWHERFGHLHFDALRKLGQ